MKHTLLFLVLIFVGLNSWAQVILPQTSTRYEADAAAAKQSILVTGDSWALFMCYESSFQKVFSRHGIKAGVFCNEASKFGARAVEWPTLLANRKMVENLSKHPNIKVVYLSMGGNDFFEAWNKKLTTDDEAKRFYKIVTDVKVIVDEILTIRPDVKVLLSGYDFGNFTKFSKVLGFDTDILKSMGEPTVGEVQRAVVRLSNMMALLADQKKVFYIQHYGLSHYYYGNSEYHLRARQTKKPEEISPPYDPTSIGGIIDEEAAPESLLKFCGVQDAYHPSPEEFYNIAKHSTGQYFLHWLK